MGRRTWHGWLGLGIMAGAMALSWAGVRPVRMVFYHLAWWGYILAVDGFIQARRGNSLLVDRRPAFFALAFASAVFWFGWELVNLRLHNWQYLNVEPRLWLRWPLAALAFATVLPGVLQTYEALDCLARGWRWGKGVRPFPAGEQWIPWFLALGTIMFLLPLLWPRLFFPLVWGALVFLLEPVNYRLGAKSLVRQWQRGDLSPFLRLLTAGFITGLLWECWNFFSDPRWAYTLPYLNRPRLFAMPLAGYLGFPPFAVECYIFASSLSLLRGGRGWEADDHGRATRPPLPIWLRVLLLAGGVGFMLVMLVLMDRYLVKTWAS